jgi:hypothetical protein
MLCYQSTAKKVAVFTTFPPLLFSRGAASSLAISGNSLNTHPRSTRTPQPPIALLQRILGAPISPLAGSGPAPCGYYKFVINHWLQGPLQRHKACAKNQADLLPQLPQMTSFNRLNCRLAMQIRGEDYIRACNTPWHRAYGSLPITPCSYQHCGYYVQSRPFCISVVCTRSRENPHSARYLALS